MDGRTRIRLWLPIFLLWPLIVLTALFAPIILLAHPGSRRELAAGAILKAGPMLILLFCRSRGFKVDVRGSGNQVYISLF